MKTAILTIRKSFTFTLTEEQKETLDMCTGFAILLASGLTTIAWLVYLGVWNNLPNPVQP